MMVMTRLKIEIPGKCIDTFFIPVRITDLNYGNHVGNDAMVAIIHEARVQFLQKHNCSEFDVFGTALIMRELQVEYKNESFYGDILRVKIYAGGISGAGFDLFYSLSVVRNEIAVNIATAKTGMVCFNYEKRKIERVPDDLRKILEAH